MDSNIQEECGRFEVVMAARKKTAELIGLFDKLPTSDKFSAEAKPYCFELLLRTTAQKVPDRELTKLLAAVQRSAAVPLVRTQVGESQADLIAAALVRRLFSATERETAPLLRAFVVAEAAGLSTGRSHTLGLLCLAQLPVEDLDAICDLTYEAYYEQSAALAA